MTRDEAERDGAEFGSGTGGSHPTRPDPATGRPASGSAPARRRRSSPAGSGKERRGEARAPWRRRRPASETGGGAELGGRSRGAEGAAAPARGARGAGSAVTGGRRRNAGSLGPGPVRGGRGSGARGRRRRGDPGRGWASWARGGWRRLERCGTTLGRRWLDGIDGAAEVAASDMPK